MSPVEQTTSPAPVGEASPGFPRNDWILDTGGRILVTGAGGFIGERLVRWLVDCGFRHIRCLVRSGDKAKELRSALGRAGNDGLEVVEGNLLSRDDCRRAAEGVSVIYHLVAGRGKSFAECFLNSVVTTRNLLDAALAGPGLKRFVNVSSMAVYSNEKLRRGGLLDETCEVEARLDLRFDAYAYGKAKQDEIVFEYARTRGLPFVILRPGVVLGPGNVKIPGRVGIDTFGVFLHLGLGNRLPVTYVDNCAEALALAGLKKGIAGEVINIMDDDLPSSREFLRLYKRQVMRFVSIPVPYRVFLCFCFLWERYAEWSEGQLPPILNRKECATYWKGNRYSNRKAKELLGWQPKVPMSECLQAYFDYSREMRNKP